MSEREIRIGRERSLSGELCALYGAAGYRQYRMRKFEEYALYLENKNFLASEHVIAFNGLDGRLLALKPDVTLSIVKNTRASDETPEKLYYAESVYRLDRKSREYREIRQIGLEMLGGVDAVETVEIMALACKSLSVISKRSVLAVSHMGFLAEVFASHGILGGAGERIAECLRTANVHALRLEAEQCGLSERDTDALAALVAFDGGAEVSLAAAAYLAKTPAAKTALGELTSVLDALRALGFGGMLRPDFSVVSDREYYNGIVFSGYIEGVPKAVLFGGRYDRLAEKLGKPLCAMGFAVYLSDLSYYLRSTDEYDVDVLLLYGNTDDPARVIATAESLRRQGYSVRVAEHELREIRVKRILRVEEVTIC